MDTLQRDRFELLSAYLDGEVTAAERKQVEMWLAEDPTMQRLHARLMKLRQGFQAMPIPAPSRSVEQTVEQVFAKVEQRPNLRLIWGGAAIAALFVGGLATLFATSDRSFAPQFAKQEPQEQVQPSTAKNPDAEPLVIALDKPLVELPKTAVAEPVNPTQAPAK